MRSSTRPRRPWGAPLRLLLGASLLSLVATTAPASADERPAAVRDPEVGRLLEAQDTVRWTQPWAGQRYGHAETLVAASFDDVKRTLVDYGHYKDLHHAFASARVVAKEPEHTDVYLRLPVKAGSARVDPWEILRFGTLKATPAYAVVEARGTSGNLRQAHVVLSARQIDGKHALVKVDVLFVPNLAGAQSKLDEELRDMASALANGLRYRAQGTPEPVRSLTADSARASAG